MSLLLTLPEVAAQLRVSVGTLRNWRAQGKLRVIQLPGGTLRVRQEEVDRLLGSEEPLRSAV